MTRPILRACEQRDLNDTESNRQTRIDCPTHRREHPPSGLSACFCGRFALADTSVDCGHRCTDLRSIAGNRRYRLLAEWKYQESVHSRVSVCVMRVRESRTSSISGLTKYLCLISFQVECINSELKPKTKCIENSHGNVRFYLSTLQYTNKYANTLMIECKSISSYINILLQKENVSKNESTLWNTSRKLDS